MLAEIELESLQSRRIGAVFKVSSKKAECGVGFLGNIGDVCCPFKIIRYLKSNVWPEELGSD
jgi:hypothetical protein